MRLGFIGFGLLVIVGAVQRTRVQRILYAVGFAWLIYKE
jgi:hypothetical protein